MALEFVFPSFFMPYGKSI